MSAGASARPRARRRPSRSAGRRLAFTRICASISYKSFSWHRCCPFAALLLLHKRAKTERESERPAIKDANARDYGERKRRAVAGRGDAAICMLVWEDRVRFTAATDRWPLCEQLCSFLWGAHTFFFRACFPNRCRDGRSSFESSCCAKIPPRPLLSINHGSSDETFD